MQVLGSGGVIITSGCCANLAHWRDWERVLDGRKPRLGHDPEVEARLVDGAVIVESATIVEHTDGSLRERPDTIVIPVGRYRAALDEAEAELDRIATRVGAWATKLASAEMGAEMEAGFRASFDLRPR
jgi:hypothetical protein